MESHAAAPRDPSASRLLALAERCLSEPPSRHLDGEIYCAVHHIEDVNDLSSDTLRQAWQRGQVLVEHHRGAEIGWIEAPPFTEELRYAETLLPDGVATVCRDARRACATALNVRALVDAAPPPVCDVFESREANPGPGDRGDRRR